MRPVSKKTGIGIGRGVAWHTRIPQVYIKLIRNRLTTTYFFHRSQQMPPLLSMPHTRREELDDPSITKHNQGRNEQDYNQRNEEHRHVEILANISTNDWHDEASDGRTHG